MDDQRSQPHFVPCHKLEGTDHYNSYAHKMSSHRDYSSVLHDAGAARALEGVELDRLDVRVHHLVDELRTD